jgi:hypothetical protein
MQMLPWLAWSIMSMVDHGLGPDMTSALPTSCECLPLANIPWQVRRWTQQPTSDMSQGLMQNIGKTSENGSVVSQPARCSKSGVVWHLPCKSGDCYSARSLFISSGGSDWTCSGRERLDTLQEQDAGNPASVLSGWFQLVVFSWGCPNHGGAFC